MPAARSAMKAVFGDVLGQVAYAPVFWYSQGAADAGAYCLRLIKHRYRSLGLGVWAKNLFVPMFGQRDIPGVLISLFMRLVQIIARSLVMVLWIALVAALYIAYLAAPVFIIIILFRQIAGLFAS